MVLPWRCGEFQCLTMKLQAVVPRLYTVKSHAGQESRPEDIDMPKLSHSHSATYWQQEVIGGIF